MRHGQAFPSQREGGSGLEKYMGCTEDQFQDFGVALRNLNKVLQEQISAVYDVIIH